jgi:hypothetical protein
MVLHKFGGYRYSFADPLRAMLKAGLMIDMADPYWSTRKEDPIPAYGNKSPRQLLQWLGTEWGRNLVDENIWVTVATKEFLLRGPGMVIADVRFENEAFWIRRMGGTIIHLMRPGAPPVATHASENGVMIDPRDGLLRNDGTLADLQSRLYAILGDEET